MADKIKTTKKIQENIKKGYSSNDFYKGSADKKVIDFLIGFFAVPILLIAIALLSFPLLFVGIAISLLMIIDIIVLILLGIAYLIKFRNRRRYISIGLLVSIIIPILAFGACWVLLSSLG
jgi:hypothetical protein